MELCSVADTLLASASSVEIEDELETQTLPNTVFVDDATWRNLGLGDGEAYACKLRAVKHVYRFQQWSSLVLFPVQQLRYAKRESPHTYRSSSITGLLESQVHNC